jgi:hypothetical protein
MGDLSALSDVNAARALIYDIWREEMLQMCKNPPDRMCPFCGEVYEDNAEYVDAGVGYQQVTANVCENPECGAQEQGCYTYEGDEWEFAFGWVHLKDEPEPKYDFMPSMLIDFIDGMDMAEPKNTNKGIAARTL